MQLIGIQSANFIQNLPGIQIMFITAKKKNNNKKTVQDPTQGSVLNSRVSSVSFNQEPPPSLYLSWPSYVWRVGASYCVKQPSVWACLMMVPRDLIPGVHFWQENRRRGAVSFSGYCVRRQGCWLASLLLSLSGWGVLHRTATAFPFVSVNNSWGDVLRPCKDSVSYLIFYLTGFNIHWWFLPVSLITMMVAKW